jgi:virginiamycin A acetyltransferase
MLRSGLKLVIIALALSCVFPFAVVSGFGRGAGPFQFFGQLLALVPGLPGDYLRVAYYAMTLKRCSLNTRISFGTFFSRRDAVVEKSVYIGSNCIIGNCRIGERTQVSSQVQILGGRHQHGRDRQGRLLGSNEGEFIPVVVGHDCWLGASSVIMADVGSGTTIGAGAVVSRPIPDSVVAVGNPARVIKQIGS